MITALTTIWNLRSYAGYAVLSLALAGAVGYGLTLRAEVAELQSKLTLIYAESSRVQAEAASAALEAERKANDLRAAIDTAHLAKKEGIDEVYAENRRLAALLGGMRFNGTADRGGCPMPEPAAIAGPAAKPAAGCKLSDETADALLAIARDADRAAEYARACREWAVSVGR